MRRLFLILLMSSVVSFTFGQSKRSYRDPFLNSQWYLGFFGGVNLAKGVPQEAYSALTTLNNNPDDISKTHSGYQKMGTQAGLVFVYSTRGFNISAKPGIHSINIQHSTSARWVESANTSNSVEINYMHDTKLNYFEFPLSAHYDILKDKLRPYVGVGGYYGILINASRDIERSGVDSASGSTAQFNDQAKTIGVTDLYIKSSLGIYGYIGASYDPGNIRIFLDLGYKIGLNNVTNTENRYINNELSSIGEAMDDLTIQSIYLSLGVAFPLKFISKNYNAF